MAPDPSEYRRGFDRLPSAAVLLDGEGRVLRANPAAAELLGVERAAIESEPLVEVLVAGSTGEETTLRRAVERACNGEVAVEASPATVDTELDSTPVQIRVGSVSGETVAAVVQIDERDRTHGRDAFRQYETVVRTLPDAVFATDRSGYVTYVNPAFETLTGYGPEAIETDRVHLSELLTDSATATMQAELRDRMERTAAPGRVAYDVTVTDAEDRQIPVEAVIDTLAAGDRFEGIVGVLRDVSARRRRQEILSVMNRVLRHNLRTHVNLITGHVEMVEPSVDDERRDHLDGVVDSAEWLGKLGRTLRELQEAVEQGRGGDPDADLQSLIEDVVLEVRRSYPEANYEVRIDHDERIEVRSALRYALANVVENAVEHSSTSPPSQAREDAVEHSSTSPPSDAREDAVDPANHDVPTVEVWVTEGSQEGWFEILVADDGPGIPDHERETVLSEAEITQLEHGSGIGLWVTRWIVESLGGEIAIAADEDGTTVSLALPQSGRASDDYR